MGIIGVHIGKKTPLETDWKHLSGSEIMEYSKQLQSYGYKLRHNEKKAS